MGTPVQFVFTPNDVGAVAAAQTAAGAGFLTINGTQLDKAATMQGVNRVVLDAGIERTITFSSTADLSAANITVYGWDLRGTAVSEARAGPNANVVSTTTLFHTVSAVHTDVALATAMSVGTGGVGNTNWYVVNKHITPANIALYVTISGTATTFIQDTPDNPQSVTSPATYNLSSFSGITTSINGNYAYPPNAIRGRVSAASANAQVQFTFIPAGIAQ